MQAELHGAVVQRRAGDTGEVPNGGIGIGLGKFGMIRQIEKVCGESQPRSFSDGDLEIFLQREIEVVDAGIANVREITGCIPEGFGDIEWMSDREQASGGTRSGKIERSRVEPLLHGLMEAGRKGVADHRGAVGQDTSAVAESIGIIGDAEWSSCANGVDGA